MGQLRRKWPGVEILLCADSGFCREELMSWCEQQGVDYVFGTLLTPPRVAPDATPSVRNSYCTWRPPSTAPNSFRKPLPARPAMPGEKSGLKLRARPLYDPLRTRQILPWRISASAPCKTDAPTPQQIRCRQPQRLLPLATLLPALSSCPSPCSIVYGSPPLPAPHHPADSHHSLLSEQAAAREDGGRYAHSRETVPVGGRPAPRFRLLCQQWRKEQPCRSVRAAVRAAPS